ncbi:hypothetical protein LZD49_23975 [Dyadobacter sp. CY261]|uniref:hypothetical protein n=1 Tax=Dyadobacter sp. CY261 TaxID=2907203 RepID=UPI001F1D4980|nr:hypothetical protein [Dyadobacter sp. CY261]MCF0073559.1 hypothetical protein [Dyadobacter sp. CY261]
MKTLITTFVSVIALTSSVAFADDNKSANTIKNTLPASTPAVETPAPPKAKSTNTYITYTPTQKAAIVELKTTK